ncbi:MAG: TVP38/TMEM64 family protein [Dongiaceae bacterium]
MTKARWLLLAAIVALIAAFFAFDLGRFLSLDQLRASKAAIDAYRDAHPVLASAAYFGTYVAVTALSLPGAAILTLAGGATFGLLWGLLLVSFASSSGATLAFLTSRFLLHDAIQSRYGDRLKAINDGVRRDGAFYLFTLRLVPVFPFFIVNLVMGLTPIRPWTFYWVSQVGMLAGTIVYVYAGTELGKIESLKGILSPTLIAAFVLLGLFPLIARKAVEKINARRHKDEAAAAKRPS